MLRSIALLEVAIKVPILVANPDITDLSSVYTEVDCDNHWYADDSTAVSPAVSAVPFTDDSLRPAGRFVWSIQGRRCRSQSVPGTQCRSQSVYSCTLVVVVVAAVACCCCLCCCCCCCGCYLILWANPIASRVKQQSYKSRLKRQLQQAGSLCLAHSADHGGGRRVALGGGSPSRMPSWSASEDGAGGRIGGDGHLGASRRSRASP